MWVENQWDHKFLVWSNDPWSKTLKELDPEGTVIVDFNPTAENMGEYLINIIGPIVLSGTEVTLVKVKIEETRKCSVNVAL